jgi:xanthine dehydrogenase YagR molybdenum-binding subunit
VSIGQPLPRVDGRIKVTGAARYTADIQLPNMLHGVFVTAALPAGRVKTIDPSAALAEPGVVQVLTHRDFPRLRIEAQGPPFSQTFLPMQGDAIRYEGQPVAIVLGETLEAAEAGAQRVGVVIERADARMPAADWDSIERVAVTPKKSGFLFFEPQFVKGEPEHAFSRAQRRIDVQYTQPTRHHNPMEPSAVLATWDGDQLTLHDSTQHVYGVQAGLAAALRMPPERVRVIAQHTGGGFGVKGWIWPQEVLAALAAKVAARPVRLVLTRANLYSFLGFQTRVAQRLSLGSDAQGRLAAITHDAVSLTTVSDDYVEFAIAATLEMYETRTMRLRQRVERANVAMPTAMRAPVEGPGMWALESAMDELAHRVGIDPLDLRLANYAEKNPASGEPWSSKKLREAYEEGARLFRWRERPKAPQRDGAWLVGQGMASCMMGTFRNPSKAEVRLQADGSAVVLTGTQDIGTGTLTIFPQIAADVLGLPIHKVGLQMGDTRLPEAGPTYGSSSTMGVGSAVFDAARKVRDALARLANIAPGDAEMVDGLIRRKGTSGGVAIADAMRNAGQDEIAAAGSFDPQQHGKGLAMCNFGVVFVEVGVDPELGLLRLRRAVGSYSAGRIINPRTAKAQMSGGIVWGWGMAAMEQSPFDTTLGRFVSKNLAGVAIPVHADIPADITIHFVDEVDEHASPIGARGIGELGATGVAAAVANAVFHATGKRIRDLPLTPDKLIAD